MDGLPFWGRYVHHDNNRDINFSQVTTHALLEWYLRWHPPIIHDLQVEKVGEVNMLLNAILNYNDLEKR